MTALQDKDPWAVTAAAWKTMVAKWKLSNWWQAVSLDNSSVVVIKTESIDHVPDVASTNYYGEFAGGVSVPSLFSYGEFNKNSQPPTDAVVVIAGVRLLVQIQNHEKKPIPLTIDAMVGRCCCAAGLGGCAAAQPYRRRESKSDRRSRTHPLEKNHRVVNPKTTRRPCFPSSRSTLYSNLFMVA